MKKNIFKKLVGLVITCFILTLFNNGIAYAASSYSPDKALAYAASHWNDGNELCAGFVSNCLKAGGISPWSRSASDLHRQLVNSGLGTEYKINLTNGYIKTTLLSPGDVIFYYCPKCVNIDGKPYIHTVLYKGNDASGYAKCYSHNNANSASSRYGYSSTCYSCGGSVSYAYAYHFATADPIGSLDLLTTDAGTVRVAGWAFDRAKTSAKLQIEVYVGGDKNSGKRYTLTTDHTRDDVNTAYPGVGSNHGFDKVISVPNRGNTPVYVYAVSADGSKSILLGSKTLNIQEPFSFKYVGNNLSVNTFTTSGMGFTFSGSGIAKMKVEISSNIISAKLDSVDWSKGTGKVLITSKNVSGKANVTVIMLDNNGKELYRSTALPVTVKSKPSEIKTSSSSLDLDMKNGSSKTVTLTWDTSGGATQVKPSITGNVVSVSYTDVKADSMKAVFKPLKKGTGTATFTLVDAFGATLGKTEVKITVKDSSETKPVELKVSYAQQQVSMDTYSSAEAGFTFSGNGIAKMRVEASSNIIDAQLSSVDWSKGTGKVLLKSKNVSGKSNVTIILVGDDGKELYRSAVLPVTVKSKPSEIKASSSSVELDMKNGSSKTITLTWDTTGGATQVVPSFSNDIVSVSYTDVKADSMKAVFKPVKKGTGTATFTLVDAEGASLGKTEVKIIVQDSGETQKNEFAINYAESQIAMAPCTNAAMNFTFQGDGIKTMAVTSSDSQKLRAELSNVNWTKGTGTISLTSANYATVETITLIMKDNGGKELYRKAFQAEVQAKEAGLQISDSSVSIEQGEQKEVRLSWNRDSGASQVYPSFDDAVISIAYKEVTPESMKMVITGKKAGSTTASFTLKTPAGESLAAVSTDIVVKANKMAESATPAVTKAVEKDFIEDEDVTGEEMDEEFAEDLSGEELEAEEFETDDEKGGDEDIEMGLDIEADMEDDMSAGMEDSNESEDGIGEVELETENDPEIADEAGDDYEGMNSEAQNKQEIVIESEDIIGSGTEGKGNDSYETEKGNTQTAEVTDAQGNVKMEEAPLENDVSGTSAKSNFAEIKKYAEKIVKTCKNIGMNKETYKKWCKGLMEKRGWGNYTYLLDLL